ncbi:hypothetical protein E2542_SST05162 [Spatholobus suberectus]|nr:hypothetical protein E2542_SST05162 [Spatholobus suberectus]
MDSHNHYNLTTLHTLDSLPLFDTLAAYDLHSDHHVFLSLLPSTTSNERRLVVNNNMANFNNNTSGQTPCQMGIAGAQ